MSATWRDGLLSGIMLDREELLASLTMSSAFVVKIESLLVRPVREFRQQQCMPSSHSAASDVQLDFLCMHQA